MSNTEYKQKYFKYKQKYLEIKTGGASQSEINVSPEIDLNLYIDNDYNRIMNDLPKHLHEFFLYIF